MYGILDDTFMDKLVGSVQGFWPGATFDELAFGSEDESVALSLANRLPILVLLANEVNDERAALAIHPNGTFYAQKLNKDTLSEEWGAFVDVEEVRFLEDKL